MDDIEAIGAVTSKSISGRDVTEEFVDLSARLGNLERQELRLLDILNMTTTVDEVLDVERELGRIRGEIESLTGGWIIWTTGLIFQRSMCVWASQGLLHIHGVCGMHCLIRLMVLYLLSMDWSCWSGMFFRYWYSWLWAAVSLYLSGIGFVGEHGCNLSE